MLALYSLAHERVCTMSHGVIARVLQGDLFGVNPDLQPDLQVVGKASGDEAQGVFSLAR